MSREVGGSVAEVCPTEMFHARCSGILEVFMRHLHRHVCAESTNFRVSFVKCSYQIQLRHSGRFKCSHSQANSSWCITSLTLSPNLICYSIECKSTVTRRVLFIGLHRDFLQKIIPKPPWWRIDNLFWRRSSAQLWWTFSISTPRYFRYVGLPWQQSRFTQSHKGVTRTCARCAWVIIVRLQFPGSENKSLSSNILRLGYITRI